MSEAPTLCGECGIVPIVRKPTEEMKDFRKRRFCSNLCACRNMQKKSPKPSAQRTFDLFIKKICPEPNSGCWLWTATLHSAGYGQLRIGGKAVYAHRYSYERFVGPIPDGLTIDHKCRVRSCCNPDHLEAVTQGENNRRAGAVKTHCPHGHPYSGDNLYVPPRGGRQCRICIKERGRAA